MENKNLNTGDSAAVLQLALQIVNDPDAWSVVKSAIHVAAAYLDRNEYSYYHPMDTIERKLAEMRNGQTEATEQTEQTESSNL